MIICSCNVLSDGDIKACLKPGPACPRTTSEVYKCFGCSPKCGRCVRSIRALMNEAVRGAHADCGTACETNCPKPLLAGRKPLPHVVAAQGAQDAIDVAEADPASSRSPAQDIVARQAAERHAAEQAAVAVA